MNKNRLSEALMKMLAGLESDTSEEFYTATCILVAELLGVEAVADLTGKINCTDGMFYWRGEYTDQTRRGFEQQWGLS